MKSVYKHSGAALGVEDGQRAPFKFISPTLGSQSEFSAHRKATER
ncbi:MAG: hypothetical protein ACXW6T_25395 [Candidatus Binatia bacterium]